MTSGVQSVVEGVHLPLPFGIAEARTCFGIFIDALVSIRYFSCFSIREASGLHCQEIGEVIMHIDLIQA